LEEMDQQDGDLEHAMSLMEKHKSLHDTVDRARHYGSIARDALGLFRECPMKGAMVEAIDFAIERAY
jgi:octaprenyl-diphosphate synthase